jgi:hypothetical protein
MYRLQNARRQNSTPIRPNPGAGESSGPMPRTICDRTLPGTVWQGPFRRVVSALRSGERTFGGITVPQAWATAPHGYGPARPRPRCGPGSTPTASAARTGEPARGTDRGAGTEPNARSCWYPVHNPPPPRGQRHRPKWTAPPPTWTNPPEAWTSTKSTKPPHLAVAREERPLHLVFFP